MKPVEVLIEKQQAKNERLLTLEYLILNKAAGEDGAYKTNDNTPSNVAAAELAALTARLAQAERALYDLFQGCSNLCLDDMNKLDKEINQAVEALKSLARQP